MINKYLYQSLLTFGVLFFNTNFTIAQHGGRSDPANHKTPNSRSNELGNVEGITADQLRNYLTFIASNEMAGRATPSKELDITANFIAFNLSRWKGLKPVGTDGTFFQKMVLTGELVVPEKTMVALNEAGLKFGEDYIANYPAGSVSGEMVFISSGIRIKKKNIDSYKGIDVKDKIVVGTFGHFPKGVNNSDFTGKIGEDYDLLHHYARTHGAKAIIYIASKEYQINWKQRTSVILYADYWRDPDESVSSIPVIVISRSIAKQLFKNEKLEFENIALEMEEGKLVESFALSSDKKVNLQISTIEVTAPTQNIVAILEGSDPVLKNEYVAISAHYDHLGTTCAPPDSPKNICNGADDNGSGTAALLSIAEAISNGARPKRSILFIWPAGEENSLAGSAYFTEHLPVPASSIVALFNMDMIGRSKKDGDTNPKNANLTGPHEIYVIGSKLMSTALGEISASVNDSYLKLQLNYKYDDNLYDRRNPFYRSDHFNFVKKNIPCIFYFSGDHEDYHRITDTSDKINYLKIEKVARTILATVWKAANTTDRLVVDKELPELIKEARKQ